MLTWPHRPHTTATTQISSAPIVDLSENRIVGLMDFRDFCTEVIRCHDAGRQMDILAVSVWLRYLQQCGESLPFPESAYQGAYIGTIAAMLREAHGSSLRCDANEVLENLPADASTGGDKEVYIDALIARMRALLDEKQFALVFAAGLDFILEEIRTDLQTFGVHFDRWYSERSLLQSGAIERAVERLGEAGHTYQKDGALWFRSTSFGDDKDRVIIRESGVPTYFPLNGLSGTYNAVALPSTAFDDTTDGPVTAVAMDYTTEPELLFTAEPLYLTW